MGLPLTRNIDRRSQHIGKQTAAARRRLRLTPARLVMWLMMIATIILATVFVVQIGMFRSPLPTTEGEQQVENPEVAVARAVRFTGFDGDDQPFSVEAERAVQDLDQPSRVHLEQVRIEMRLRSSGDTLLVTAKQGVFDDKLKTLDLSGDVHIVNSANYAADMQKARVFLREKRLISSDPVEVRFPSGTINAGGMEMRDDGQQVYFTNRARTLFSERSARHDAEKPQGQRP